MFGRALRDLRAWWDRVQPGFWRRMNPGYRWAIIIFAAVVLYIGTGVFGSHKQDQAPSDAAARTNDIPRVQVARLVSSDRDATLTIRGRTQALHSVDTRAQVDGI